MRLRGGATGVNRPGGEWVAFRVHLSSFGYSLRTTDRDQLPTTNDQLPMNSQLPTSKLSQNKALLGVGSWKLVVDLAHYQLIRQITCPRRPPGSKVLAVSW